MTAASATGRLVVNSYLTLDGVGQAPGGPDEDESDGFRHGGWQAPFLDESTGVAALEHHREMDAMLLGRRTYETFAGYWPTAGDGNPFAALMNETPKYVASRTLRGQLSWNASQLLHDDLAAAVAEVKTRHAQVQVIGSLDLAQSLFRLGLVDQLHLWVQPLVLGSGKRLFGEGTVPAALRLVDGRVYDNGNLQLVYDVDGVPTTGLRVDGDTLDALDLTGD